MKTTGIIMSGNHPQLILDGTKTITRRTWGLEMVNQFPDDWRFIRMEGDLAVFLLLKKHSGKIVSARSNSREIRGEEPNLEFLFKCPYGQVGDLLWVRETHAFVYDFGRPPEDTVKQIVYKADGVFYKPWRPSIHMPRWASRITLEITDVRAERVQDITSWDCIAEGISQKYNSGRYFELYGMATDKPNHCLIEEYKVLWDSLNAKRGYPWSANNWVWPISFKEIPSG